MKTESIEDKRKSHRENRHQLLKWCCGTIELFGKINLVGMVSYKPKKSFTLGLFSEIYFGWIWVTVRINYENDCDSKGTHQHWSWLYFKLTHIKLIFKNKSVFNTSGRSFCNYEVRLLKDVLEIYYVVFAIGLVAAPSVPQGSPPRLVYTQFSIKHKTITCFVRVFCSSLLLLCMDYKTFYIPCSVLKSLMTFALWRGGLGMKV